MAVNKVDFGGNTLIDLTGDTLESAEQLLKGIIAHAKDGSVITGQMESGGGGSGNIAYGTITPADASANLEIVHGLGKVPDFFCIVASNDINDVYSKSSPNGQSFIYAIRGTNTSINNRYYGRYQYDKTVGYGRGSIFPTISSGFNYHIALGENNAIWAVRNSTNGLFRQPAPFFWLAIADEGIVQ